MTPSSELRTQLRAALDERVPENGTDADTQFLDADLDAWLLVPSGSVEEAAWRGWVLKMGWSLKKASKSLLEKSIGSERLKFATSSAKEQFEHARTMADYYLSLMPESAEEAARTASLLFDVEGADVLGLKTVCYDDLSRLLPEGAGWC